MADDVLFNDGDALSEANIGEVLSRANATDYVESGLGFAADFNNDTLTIGSGEAYVDDGGQTYVVQPDQRTGLGLAPSDVNHVFLTFDPDASDVEGSVTYHIDTADSAPAGQPSLKIGMVDTGGDSATELNRNPSISAENIGLGNVTGDGVPAQAIEHGKAWADDGQLYDDLSSAESAATDVLIIGPGTFGSDSNFAGNEALRVTTTDLTVVCSGRNTVFDAGSNIAVRVDADGVTLSSCAVKADGFLVTGSDGLFEDITVIESTSEGIHISTGTRNRVLSALVESASVSNEDVLLDSDNNLVDDIVGTVTDNGAGNTVGETV